MNDEKKNMLIGISIRLRSELDKLNIIVGELTEKVNVPEEETHSAEYEQDLADWSTLSTDAEIIDSIITDMENIASK